MPSTHFSGNEQEQYWRIPARLSADSLKTKAAFLAKAMNGDLEVGDLNAEHLGVRSSSSKAKKTKKKKEKRGPNKWLPMKRQVDEEALARSVGKRLSARFAVVRRRTTRSDGWKSLT
jgi:hypothetical protein